MKTFYLQFGIPNNDEGKSEPRIFLDTYLHPHCELLKEIQAETWIEARTTIAL